MCNHCRSFLLQQFFMDIGNGYIRDVELRIKTFRKLKSALIDRHQWNPSENPCEKYDYDYVIMRSMRYSGAEESGEESTDEDDSEPDSSDLPYRISDTK